MITLSLIVFPQMVCEVGNGFIRPINTGYENTFKLNALCLSLQSQCRSQGRNLFVHLIFIMQVLLNLMSN